MNETPDLAPLEGLSPAEFRLVTSTYALDLLDEADCHKIPITRVSKFLRPALRTVLDGDGDIGTFSSRRRRFPFRTTYLFPNYLDKSFKESPFYYEVHNACSFLLQAGYNITRGNDARIVKSAIANDLQLCTTYLASYIYHRDARHQATFTTQECLFDYLDSDEFAKPDPHILRMWQVGLVSPRASKTAYSDRLELLKTELISPENHASIDNELEDSSPPSADRRHWTKTTWADEPDDSPPELPSSISPTLNSPQIA